MFHHHIQQFVRAHPASKLLKLLLSMELFHFAWRFLQLGFPFSKCPLYLLLLLDFQLSWVRVFLVCTKLDDPFSEGLPQGLMLCLFLVSYEATLHQDFV